MTFKKLLIILSFTVTSFSNVQTFNEDMNSIIIFEKDDNIGGIISIPLTADQVEKYSSKTKFNWTYSDDDNTKEVGFQITLINLNIDPELTTNTDLKYSLIEKIGNGSPVEVASGNFMGVTEDSLVIKPMAEISSFGVTHSYEFRIWLEETGANQNTMMGKKVTGKIKVSTAIR